MLQEANGSCRAVQLEYFIKEFPGFEIESKWELLSQSPVILMLGFVSDIKKEAWTPYQISKAMGKLPVGIRYFELNFLFFGLQTKNEWDQVAMAAEFPEQDLYQLTFKEKTHFFQPNGITLANPPLIRKEDRKGKWISKSKMMEAIHIAEPNALHVGTIRREKISVYITNSITRRNFNISADFCHKENKRTLSQIEVEYKGRSGLWIPDTTGEEVLAEFSALHSILENQYKNVFCPTTTTKFEWIMSL